MSPRIRDGGPRRRRGGLLADSRGTSAVEFSLLLPVFCVILVGVIDFGGVLFKKFRLNSAVSAGANYALVHAASVTAANGSTLANSIASIMASSNTAQATTGTIVVNNGPSATVTGTGTNTAGGTAAHADSCYCPTGTAAALVWGAAQACGTTCSGGVPAGRYVAIVARQTYTPSFSGYGLVENGTIVSAAVVRAQ